MTVVEFPAEGGSSVIVRAVPAGLDELVTRGDRLAFAMERAERTFESSLGTIKVVAAGVLAQLVDIGRRPEEVQVEFELQLTAKAGAVLAEMGGAAHLRVGLTWRANPPSRGGT